jgi:hypothetical protein
MKSRILATAAATATMMAVTIFSSGCCNQKPVTCPPPIVVNCEYKVWPVQRTPDLPELKVRRMDSPGIIGGVTQDDIESFSFSFKQMLLWGSKNENTLDEVNKLSKDNKK